MTAPGPRRRQRKAVPPPEFPPDNELPAVLDAGPFIWRSADVGITATGFLAYSTGVLFRLVVLSKGVNLSGEDPVESFAGEQEAYGLGSERPAGTLRLGAHGVPITTHSASRRENRLEIEAWTAFPPDGDLVFHLEWPAEGIEHSEFRIPRSAAAKAVTLWPAVPCRRADGAHGCLPAREEEDLAKLALVGLVEER